MKLAGSSLIRASKGRSLTVQIDILVQQTFLHGLGIHVIIFSIRLDLVNNVAFEERYVE